jgi:hypothetical protein
MTSGPPILYLDCPSGVSGDMLVAALLDLGVPLARLQSVLRGLALRGYRVRTLRVRRAGISARRFIVEAGHEHSHRGLREIGRILRRSRLPAPVRERSLAVVRRLVEAEARVHRLPLQRVHLHEVGAVDAIVDIVSACACLHLLGVGRIVCSPLPLGGGRVRAEHGSLPVPAPATLELVRGLPVRGGPVQAETVTPTGAALVATLADAFGPAPDMIVERIGAGAGERDFAEHPNILRAWWGRPAAVAAAGTAARSGSIKVLEANLDDLNPQVYGYLMERLLAAGALDVFYTPVQMKKNRPGTQITALARPERAGALEEILFEETSTLGIRSWEAARRELERRLLPVRTPYGIIPMKIASGGDRVLHAAPEYEPCARAARRHRVPLKRVQEAALAAHQARRRSARS